MSSDYSKKEHHKCNACDFQILRQLENNPAVRKLQDKIEQLSLRLAECRNENQMLKRDLQLAKKMVYQEIGDSDIDFKNLINSETEQGWKGRQESVLVLKTKVQELTDYLKELEGDPHMTQDSSSEMFVKQKMPNDKKKLWRMELERRLTRESAEKDINPLVQECFDLRRKLDIAKNRFKELGEEIKLLRAELNSHVAKNEEDVGIVNSFKTLENQLQETLAGRADIRKDLNGTRTRNKRLADEVESLQEELRVLQKKNHDSNSLIDSLTNTHRSIQESIDAEKQIAQQNVERYKEDLGKLLKHQAEDVEILDHLQCILCDRGDLVEELEKEVEEGLMLDQQEKKGAKGSRSSELGRKPSTHSKGSHDEGKKNGIDSKSDGLEKKPSRGSKMTDEVNKKFKGSKTGEQDKLPSKVSKTLRPGLSKSKEDDAIETLPDPIELEMSVHKLRLECAKFKVLCRASKMENERLPILLVNLDSKMNEVAVLAVETGGLIRQKSEEKKVLLEKINSLQRSLSAKRKKGKINVAPKSKLEEMRIKCETQRDENEFLRDFLRSAVCYKGKDVQLITGFIADSKQFFQTSLKSVKESLVKDTVRQSSLCSMESVN